MMKNFREDKVENINFRKIFSKKAQDLAKIFHGVLLIMKFSQTKPQVEIMNLNYFEFCCVVF